MLFKNGSISGAHGVRAQVLRRVEESTHDIHYSEVILGFGENGRNVAIIGIWELMNEKKENNKGERRGGVSWLLAGFLAVSVIWN